MRKSLLLVCALLLLGLGLLGGWFHPAFLDKKTETDSSQESFPVMIRTNGGLLEVGTVRYRKVYKLRNVAVMMGMELPFCAEESSVTINPHITYRVRLAKRWVAEYRNKTLYVTAPALEPSLPVAFDTSKLDEQLTKCWFMMGMDTRKELLRSLTGTLEKEAKAASRVDYAREHGARDTVREFVQKWMVTQKGYDIPANAFIDVGFADE